MKKIKTELNAELLCKDPSKSTAIGDLTMDNIFKTVGKLNSYNYSKELYVPAAQYESLLDAQDKYYAQMTYGTDNVVKYEGKWVSKEEAFFRDIGKL